MAKGKRNRLLIGVAGFVGLLIAALLAAPLFIDVAAYKPEIVAQVKRATGRDVVIEGPIRLSLLPTPAVALDGVKFFNLPGSKNPDMVEVKSVVVKPVLLALLWGEVEPGEVTLVEPKIVLEINAQGKPNWEFTPSVAEAVPAAAKPASPKPLSLGRLTVENGTLIFSEFAGRPVGVGRQGQLQRLGRLDRRALCAGRRRGRQRCAAQDRPGRGRKDCRRSRRRRRPRSGRRQARLQGNPERARPGGAAVGPGVGRVG